MGKNIKILLLAVTIPLIMMGACVQIAGVRNNPSAESLSIFQKMFWMAPFLTGLIITFRISLSPLGRAGLTLVYIVGESFLLIYSLFWFNGIFFGLWL